MRRMSSLTHIYAILCPESSEGYYSAAFSLANYTRIFSLSSFIFSSSSNSRVFEWSLAALSWHSKLQRAQHPFGVRCDL